jgi:LuxR family transcriptional regulator, maltose regulon positive regulatory protein
MREGLSARLVLVSAPAGFGKTSLLAEWAAQHPVPVAWVTLDEGDNDLSRFLTYLISGLQKILPGAGLTVLAGLTAAETGAERFDLAPLINDIAESQQEIVLVLDDYHLIQALPVHQTLISLVESDARKHADGDCYPL